MLCLGLSGAGKTTLLSLLAGEPTDCIKSTPGFTVKAFITPSASYSIKELGGMESIRPYWNKYYGGQDAIVRPLKFFTYLQSTPPFSFASRYLS